MVGSAAEGTTGSLGNHECSIISHLWLLGRVDSWMIGAYDRPEMPPTVPRVADIGCVFSVLHP